MGCQGENQVDDQERKVQERMSTVNRVIVTTPQDVAVLDARKILMFARELNIPVTGVVENMSGLVCPHCRTRIDLFKQGGGEKAAKEDSKAAKAFQNIVFKIEGAK